MGDLIDWQFNDGGRKDSGYKGFSGDCVVRAIAIATEQPYAQVYDELQERQKHWWATSRKRFIVKKRKLGTPAPSIRNKSYREVYEPYLKSIGWHWRPTMKVGVGCKVHLRADELPRARLIVAVSKHLTAVVNGTILDTYDCSREGTRCVYGYYIQSEQV